MKSEIVIQGRRIAKSCWRSHQEVRVSKPLRLSDLSPARQALVRLCQAVNYGSVEDLEVRHGEPVFDPWPVTVRNVKLTGEDEPRPELSLTDFALSDGVVRLMRGLDELKCGTIRRIDVHGGLPQRMLVESRISHQPSRTG
jgi:hypothetical protein